MADKVFEPNDQFRQGIESAFEAVSERFSPDPQVTEHGWTYWMDNSTYEFSFNKKTSLVMLQSQHLSSANPDELAKTVDRVNSDTLLGTIQVENGIVKIKSEVVVHWEQDAESLAKAVRFIWENSQALKQTVIV